MGSMHATADVTSTLPLGDGAWSISLTTGRLERGDGRPIVDPRSRSEAVNLGNKEAWQAYYKEAKGGVKPDHLVGDGNPGSGRRPFPRDGGAFGGSAPPTDPLNDPSLDRAVQVLRESLKKS